MWTNNVPTALRLGTKSVSSVQGCLSLLVQPQIRKSVFGGLEMTASEFEDGALQAAQTVYLELKSNSTSNCTSPTDRSRKLSDSLADLCEENLVRWLSSEVKALPAVQHDGGRSAAAVSVESVSFEHMRHVVGGGRQQANTWKQQKQTAIEDCEDDNAATSVVIDPVAVGDGLVILARRGDFGDVPEWAQSLLGLRISDTYCRKLMQDHGLAVQCAVDVTCRMMAIGETTAAGGEGDDEVAAPHQGTTSAETGSGFCVTQQWLFESGTLDPEFSLPPQWRVVDINGSGGGDFWSSPLEPAS